MESVSEKYHVGHVAYDGYFFSLYQTPDLFEAENYAARIPSAPGRRIEIRKVTTTKRIEEIFSKKG